MSTIELSNVDILHTFDILPVSFYVRDTRKIALDLLGKVIVHEYQNSVLVAKIVETEAYLGQIDPASHAYKNYTDKNSIFYAGPGISYVLSAADKYLGKSTQKLVNGSNKTFLA